MKKVILMVALAWVTNYTASSSCHYPVNGGCLTASGEIAKVGITAACPRSIKLGSRIEIGGKKYICQDRYAKWLDKRQGDTYDIFVSDVKTAIKFGKQKKEVKVL
jgi:3D (Asp-Asp-Asp) domain-containing protein